MLDWLLAAPLLIKLLVSLAAILAINAWVRNLALATCCGTLVLTLWTGHAWLPDAACDAGWFWNGTGWSFWRGDDGNPGVLLIAAQRLFGLDNLMLGAVILLVLWLSGLMGATGVMADLVASIRGAVGRRAALGVLPAVIGWLPMPGGAVFSAPLVEECDDAGTVAAMDKTRINYWFRHIWEYWWPLYPGVLLAMQESGLDTAVFVPLMLPLSAAAVLVGWCFLLRRVPRGERSAAPTEDGERVRHGFLRLISPIIVVIAVYAAVRIGFSALDDLDGGPFLDLVLGNRYLPMLVGLVAALVYLGRWRPRPAAEWRRILLDRRALLMVVLVFAVRVYGAFVESDLPGGGAMVDRLQSELSAWGIPVLLVIMIIPFVSGMATGLAIGFVGAGLPVVFSLVGGDDAPADQLLILPLAYSCGYMGMILSPVHICLIVTNRHFGTALRTSLWRLLPPAGAMLILVVGYTLLLWAVRHW